MNCPGFHRDTGGRPADLLGNTSCDHGLARTTGTVTISLPPELAVEVDRLAHQEGRTRSELLREAFRQYAGCPVS